VAGIAQVVREAYVDHFAFDANSAYFDPKSSPESPRWLMVDVEFVRKTQRLIPLSELKLLQELAALPLVKKGNRLSVMPLSESEWQAIIAQEVVKG
jgi:predicted RNA-binding protein with PUA-like domain